MKINTNKPVCVVIWLHHTVCTYVHIKSDVEEMSQPVCRRRTDSNEAIAFGFEKIPPHKFRLDYFEFSFSACFPFIKKIQFNEISMPSVCACMCFPLSAIFVKKWIMITALHSHMRRSFINIFSIVTQTITHVQTSPMGRLDAILQQRLVAQ